MQPCANPPVQEVPDHAGDVTVIRADGVAAGDGFLADGDALNLADVEEIKSVERLAATWSVGESPNRIYRTEIGVHCASNSYNSLFHELSVFYNLCY